MIRIGTPGFDYKDWYGPFFLLGLKPPRLGWPPPPMVWLRQGIDIDLLLRLMAQEFRLKEKDHAVAYRNDPPDKVGYEMFRRVVLHLSTIQDHNSLYVEPLSIKRQWTISAESVTAEGFKALEQDYEVEYNRENKTYTLRKQVEGGTLITNYDPESLSPKERAGCMRRIHWDFQTT